MKRLSYGKKSSVSHEEAEIIFFSDKWDEAQQLDHAVGWFLIDHNAAELAWIRLRQRVLTQFIEEHPGKRPWFWWRFDSPEKSRRVLSGAGIPHDIKDCDFGIPAGWKDFDPKHLPVFESQAALLKRHGLLADGEESRADFSPETVDYSNRVPFFHVE